MDAALLYLAFSALASDEPELRGTGLEYLDIAVPADLRRKIGRFLQVQEIVRKAARPRADVVEDLMNSRDSMVINRDAFRELLKSGG